MDLKKILKLFVALVSILISILFILTAYEYYNVAILKNIKDYPFGSEGPVAGIKYYKNAEVYAYAILQISLISLLSSVFMWWGFIKVKPILIIIGLVFLVFIFVLSHFDLFLI